MADAAGVGLLAGCIVALLAAPALGAQRGLLWAGLLVLLGMLLGAGWALWSRRDVMRTLIEADRQLGLRELTSTAWHLRGSAAAHAVDLAVLAVADAKCRELHSGELVFHRLGARSWTAAGLALVMVVVVSMLVGEGAGGVDTGRSAGASRASAWAMDQRGQASELRLARAGDPSDPGQRDSEPTRVPAVDTAQARSNRPGSLDEGATDAAAGGGTGEARSERAGSPDALRPGSVGGSNDGPRIAGGSGGAGGSAAAAGHAGGAMTGRRQVGPVAAPWNMPPWPSEREAAMQAVRGGAVPDRYRGLVLGYFEPTAEPR